VSFVSPLSRSKFTEVEGTQKSLFPVGPIVMIKFVVIPPNSKIDQTAKKIICLTRAGIQICRGFEMHDLIMCESKVQVVVSLGS